MGNTDEISSNDDKSSDCVVSLCRQLASVNDTS